MTVLRSEKQAAMTIPKIFPTLQAVPEGSNGPGGGAAMLLAFQRRLHLAKTSTDTAVFTWHVK